MIGTNVQGSERKPIAGEVFLRALAEHGVDFFFANPGTDFPPIVEAFSRGRHSNAKLPRPVLVPHENLAVAMAHGAYTQTGRPQVVMVHVNVGTGNTINNLINLSRDRVPLILARPVPGAAHPDPAVIGQLAGWIAKAERPLIITAGPGTDGGAVAALAKVAERAAIPVCCHNLRSFPLPSSHPMHAGFDSDPLLGDADLIIVIESDAPWYPNMQQPAPSCRVTHIGEDPIYARYPMRSFPSDLSIASPAAIALAALDAALAKKTLNVETRRAQLIERHHARRQKSAKDAQASQLNAATFSAAVGEAVGNDAIIFNEYPLSLEHCARERPGTFYGLSAAGGLGWGLRAAMGAKLAAPEKFVVATIGDGAYMFANPTVAHWVADKFDIPGLPVIFNNSRYGAG